MPIKVCNVVVAYLQSLAWLYQVYDIVHTKEQWFGTKILSRHSRILRPPEHLRHTRALSPQQNISSIQEHVLGRQAQWNTWADLVQTAKYMESLVHVKDLSCSLGKRVRVVWSCLLQLSGREPPSRLFQWQ
ncbi:hypothetical protein CEXT_146861 [Caerostris extrusa]|uniref:Uncharacterized protein n=1 Tax=Caerostris extrusa TaxID=172846 RepID=A0AAV4USW2_CAEEX|nr:hypothetical protein CEXT_146861 [Caerostris extrusa]